MKKDVQNNSLENQISFIKSFELTFPVLLAFKMAHPFRRIVISCFDIMEPLTSLFPISEKALNQLKTALLDENEYKSIVESFKEE